MAPRVASVRCSGGDDLEPCNNRKDMEVYLWIMPKLEDEINIGHLYCICVHRGRRVAEVAEKMQLAVLAGCLRCA